MSSLPFSIRPTDRRFFDDHLAEEARTGAPETCSRCGEPFDEDEGAIRAWPMDARWQVRYHPRCLGFDIADDDPDPPPTPGRTGVRRS